MVRERNQDNVSGPDQQTCSVVQSHHHIQRHTQGLVPGIRDAAHLEDVVKLAAEDSCTVIVMDMRTSTLELL